MAYTNSLQTAAATIANGAALSDAVSLGGGVLVGVVMPGTWTAAHLSFDVSVDGVTYVPLYRAAADGTISEVKITSPLASKGYRLDPADFAGWGYAKARSGLDGATTNQGAARILTLTFRPLS